jgi:hypothetical protein
MRDLSVKSSAKKAIIDGTLLLKNVNMPFA